MDDVELVMIEEVRQNSPREGDRQRARKNLRSATRLNHVVTGMAKLPDAKNTTRHINLQRNVAKRGTTASMTGTFATNSSGAP